MAPTDPILRPELLLAEREWLRRLARSLVRDEASADDLAQETLVAALERPPAPDRPIRPWLVGVARRLLAQRRRTDGRRERREERAVADDELPATDAMVERVDTQRQVAAAVLDLDEPLRTTLLLRYYEGRTSADIARSQGVPEGTVRWRLAEARKRLRERLDRDHGGERGAWMASVGALARSTPSATRAAAPLSALIGGLTMSGAIKLGVGALTLCLVGFGLLRTRDGEAERGASSTAAGDGPAVLAEAASDPPTTTLRAGGPAAADRAPVRSTAPEPDAVAAAPSVGLRLVDRDGAGLGGVEVRFDPPYAHLVAESDSDGDVHFDLTGLQLTSDSAHSAELVTSHPRLARAQARVLFPVDGPTHLGELTLVAGGSVRGWVTDDRGAPVAGARVFPVEVELTESEREAGRIHGFRERPIHPRLEARSGDDGHFELAGIPAGPTRVAAQVAGLLGDVSEPLDVRPDQPEVGVALTLASPEPWQRISGRVVGPAGEAVAGAVVRHGADGIAPHAMREVRADADGRFRLQLDRCVPWTVTAEYPTWFHGSARRTGVEPGTQGLELILGEERWIDVLVSDGGDPLQRRHEIALLDADDDSVIARTNPPIVQTRRSDEIALSAAPEAAAGPRGTRLPLPTVPFRLRVEAEGYATAEAGPFDPATAATSIEISVDRVARGALRVSVTGGGSAVSGALVFLVPDPAEEAAWRRLANREGDELDLVQRLHLPLDRLRSTADDGSVELEFDRAGAYLVVVSHAERDGSRRFGTAVEGPLDLDPFTADGPPSLRIELPAGGAIEGRVLVDPDRSPAGITVGATRGDGLVFTTVTDADGRFRLDALTAGGWQVARSDGPTMAGIGMPTGRTVEPQAQLPIDCEVEDGRTTQYDLDLRGQTPCVLAGEVIVDGAPAATWAVSLKSADAESLFAFASTTVDADGRFEMERSQGGPVIVTISSTYRGTMLSISALVELVPGRTERRIELETGRLTGRRTGPPDTWGEYLFHYTEPAPGTWTAAVVRADGEGAFDLAAAPAGSGRVLRRPADFTRPMSEWETVVEVQVPAGGEGSVEIP